MTHTMFNTPVEPLLAENHAEIVAHWRKQPVERAESVLAQQTTVYIETRLTNRQAASKANQYINAIRAALDMPFIESDSEFWTARNDSWSRDEAGEFDY